MKIARTNEEWRQVWTDYFDSGDDRARLSVLVMLKERRDVWNDKNAGEVLLTLGFRWLTERS